MTIVILKINRVDKTETIYHNVPLDVYPIYAKEVSQYAYILDYSRKHPYYKTEVKINEVEAKFNDFLRNLHKKIKGCYEIFPNKKELDFKTTPFKQTIEVKLDD